MADSKILSLKELKEREKEKEIVIQKVEIDNPVWLGFWIALGMFLFTMIIAILVVVTKGAALAVFLNLLG